MPAAERQQAVVGGTIRVEAGQAGDRLAQCGGAVMSGRLRISQSGAWLLPRSHHRRKHRVR
jgi:hypothetical protein